MAPIVNTTQIMFIKDTFLLPILSIKYPILRHPTISPKPKATIANNESSNFLEVDFPRNDKFIISTKAPEYTAIVIPVQNNYGIRCLILLERAILKVELTSSIICLFSICLDRSVSTILRSSLSFPFDIFKWS